MKKIVFIFSIVLISCAVTSAQEKPLAETAPNFQILSGRWFEKVWMRQVNTHKTFEPKTGLPSGGYNPQDIEWTSSKFFVYEASFKNETGSKIKGFAWEYVFSDLESKNVIERHKFVFARKLKNKKKLLVQANSDSPPTNLISTEDLEKNTRSPYHETIEVKCIVFNDNTTWKLNDDAENQCEELRGAIKSREEFLRRY